MNKSPTKKDNQALEIKHADENADKLRNCPRHCFKVLRESDAHSTKKIVFYRCAHCGGETDKRGWLWHRRGVRDAVQTIMNLSGTAIGYLQMLRNFSRKERTGNWRNKADKAVAKSALTKMWGELGTDDKAYLADIMEALEWEDDTNE